MSSRRRLLVTLLFLFALLVTSALALRSGHADKPATSTSSSIIPTRSATEAPIANQSEIVEKPQVSAQIEIAENPRPIEPTPGRELHSRHMRRYAASIAQNVHSQEQVRRSIASEDRVEPVSQTPLSLVPEAAPAPLKIEEPSEPLGLKIYLGVGVNYVAYDENLTEVSTNYRDLRGPATNVGVKMQATDEFGIEASYHRTPMKFENSSVALTTLESDWTSISLEGSYAKKTSKENELTFSLGTQIHQMPLAMFELMSHQPQLRDIQLLNLSVGVRDTFYLNKRTRASLLGRFQQPLLLSARTGSMKADSAFMFDGSVGLEKRAFEKVWFGLFWYGQYQRLNFSYRDSVIQTAGTQSALFSDLELRFTFEF